MGQDQLFFGQEFLIFRYHCVPLARLPTEEYVETSPLGAALSALMSSKGQDRAALMAAMMGRVSGGGLNDVLKHLLVDVIKTYLVLTPEEVERYRQFLARKEFRDVQEVELTWSERLIEQGLERGREAGIVEGKRKAVLRQLSAKFGRTPEAVTARTEGMTEADLDSVLDRILTATTFDDLGFGD